MNLSDPNFRYSAVSLSATNAACNPQLATTAPYIVEQPLSMSSADGEGEMLLLIDCLPLPSSVTIVDPGENLTQNVGKGCGFPLRSDDKVDTEGGESRPIELAIAFPVPQGTSEIVGAMLAVPFSVLVLLLENTSRISINPPSPESKMTF